MSSALLLVPLTLVGAPEPDDAAAWVDRLGVKETPLLDATLPDLDDPVRLPANPPPPHRRRVKPFIDPFLGREVAPELAVGVRGAFARERFLPDEDGRAAFLFRFDVSLYFLDLRIPANATEDIEDAPLELVLKIPMGLGRHHRLSPMFVVHAPMTGQWDDSVVELALAYHFARGPLSFKVELSGFDGRPDRGSRVGGGNFGFNLLASYSFFRRLAVVFEADGTVALSGDPGDVREEGDVFLRLLPGIRFFADREGALQFGLAGWLSAAPDDPSIARVDGVLMDVGYVFF